jgi:phospholipid-binding lipoprotein MlaA
MKNLAPISIMVSGLLLLAGCASNGDPRDPLEPMNRAIHSFNESLDQSIIKPAAEGYVAITPSPIRTGVRNFFSNLDDVVVLANNLLQLKPEAASSDLMRIAVNTTLGLAGILDIASEMGLHKHDEDFGQTLGYWGISDGPYFVMPLLGPSTFRDTAGWAVDSFLIDPVWFNQDDDVRWVGLTARLISRRSELLDAKRAIDIAALDPYEFSRDFYLEHRQAQVRDGKPAKAE